MTRSSSSSRTGSSSRRRAAGSSSPSSTSSRSPRSTRSARSSRVSPRGWPRRTRRRAETAALRDLVGPPGGSAPRTTERGLALLNRRFHQLIYRAARNRYLLDVLESLESSLALLPGTTYSAPGRPGTAQAEHARSWRRSRPTTPTGPRPPLGSTSRRPKRIRLLMLPAPRLDGPADDGRNDGASPLTAPPTVSQRCSAGGFRHAADHVAQHRSCRGR